MYSIQAVGRGAKTRHGSGATTQRRGPYLERGSARDAASSPSTAMKPPPRARARRRRRRRRRREEEGDGDDDDAVSVVVVVVVVDRSSGDAGMSSKDFTLR